MIPVNEPLLDGEEKQRLITCIETGWISSEGPFVAEFETAFAARVGRKFGVAVANGSVALEAAVAALNLGPGDEVILPSFTIISCAAAIVRAGATPVVVDCDPVHWNIDALALEALITHRTRAIMVVHIYGLPCDMRSIGEIADRHGLVIIEDAAEAHGQQCNGRPCGSFGALSTFSFYPNKHITTGEGGMVVTDDAALAERLRSLRNLCFQAGRRFVHEELGWNYRLTNLQAALGLAQLARLDEFITIKRSMGARYQALLANTPGLQLPPPSTPWAHNHYWVFGVVIDETLEIDADLAMRLLAAEGVGTRPFFWPMHEQPALKKLGLFADTRCPVSERIARKGFYLPSGLALRNEQIETVVAAVKKVFSSVTGAS